MSTAEILPEVQSQYLPGTKIQYAWDSTSLGDFKKCPRYYQYIHIDGWLPKEESIHLRFGGEYHQALHDFEDAKAKGMKHDDALRHTVRALLLRCADYQDPDPDAKPSIRVKTKLNLLRTVIWYCEEFRTDVAETIILADGTPAMEVSFKFELDFGPSYPFVHHDAPSVYPQPYILCGHLDRLVNFNNDIFVMDRKTATTTLTQHYFNRYEPDNQMTLYTLAGQVVLGTTIKGVIIDAATVQVQGSWFQRGLTFRTQGQLNEWLNDLRFLLTQAERYATDGYWPMNDTACDKYGGCRFRDICSKDPQVRGSFLKANFIQRPESNRWNPLKPR